MKDSERRGESGGGDWKRGRAREGRKFGYKGPLGQKKGFGLKREKVSPLSRGNLKKNDTKNW